jgi:GT2 family glycosyltransferase
MNLWDEGHRGCVGLTSVVIPVYNQVAFTRACLASIAEHTRAAHETIVVDNASSDGTSEYLERLSRDGSDLRVITNEANQGFTLAANQGMRAATGDYVVLLNNDTTVTPGWLTGLLHVAESDERIGIVGPRIMKPETGLVQTIGGLIFRKGGVQAPPGQGMPPDSPELQCPFEVQYVEGSCMLIKRAVIDAIGYLDESFAPAYYEDTDYCFRAREAGFRVLYSPYSEIWHHSAVTADAVKQENPEFAAVAHRNDRIFRERWSHRFW